MNTPHTILHRAASGGLYALDYRQGEAHRLPYVAPAVQTLPVRVESGYSLSAAPEPGPDLPPQEVESQIEGIRNHVFIYF